MKKFPWKPAPKPTISSSPESLESGFGNGYEQVAPLGLNNDRKKYAQKFIVENYDTKRFNDFLNEHGTHAAYLMYSYSRMKYVSVRSESWTETPHTGAGYSEFTVNVKEVVV